jgi:hypothetical protein
MGQFSLRDLMFLVVIVALILGWSIERWSAPYWEYHVAIQNGPPTQQQLNTLGNDGWELVTVTPDDLGNMSEVFKRPKQ